MSRRSITLLCAVALSGILVLTLARPGRHTIAAFAAEPGVGADAAPPQRPEPLSLSTPEPRPLQPEPTLAPRRQPAADRSPADSIRLFDGSSLAGWRTVGPWVVDAGEIYHPASKQLTPALVTEVALQRPFELSVEVMLVGRHLEDGRAVSIFDGTHRLQMRLDNQPDQFDVILSPQGPKDTQTYPFIDGVWNSLSCRLDAEGNVTATLNWSVIIRARWSPAFPVRIELECQRSGARFRNLTARYL